MPDRRADNKQSDLLVAPHKMVNVSLLNTVLKELRTFETHYTTSFRIPMELFLLSNVLFSKLNGLF